MTDMRARNSASSECAGPEELAAFVEGRLRSDERSRIELHLADCALCRETVVETARLSDQATPRPVLYTRRILAGGAGIALAASLVAAAYLQPQWLGLRTSTPYQELVAAVDGHRLVEARLTGGFPYAPMRAPVRSGGESGQDDFDLLAAAARIRSAAAASPTAPNRHAAGVANLLTGRYDQAIAELEDAVKSDPSRAEYHSDLAAAYLARGRDRESRDDLQKARAAADRAIALNAALDEAYFNRALALDALGQSPEAEQAYERALSRDPTSPWNSEIEARLRQLRRP